MDLDREIAKLDRLLQRDKITAEYHSERLVKLMDLAARDAPFPTDVYTICLLHVHIGLAREDLRGLMAEFGKVVKVETLPSKSKPRKEWWSVFVEFETHEQARAALLALNNDIPDTWPLQNKPLTVKWTGTVEETAEFRKQQQSQQPVVAHCGICHSATHDAADCRNFDGALELVAKKALGIVVPRPLPRPIPIPRGPYTLVPLAKRPRR